LDEESYIKINDVTCKKFAQGYLLRKSSQGKFFKCV
jgi:hypothetical protein